MALTNIKTSVNATKAVCQHLAMPKASDSPQAMIIVRGAGCEDITCLQPCDPCVFLRKGRIHPKAAGMHVICLTCSTSVLGGPGDKPPV